MSELSPMTQAVLTAYNQRELATKRTTALAAALRAAADQVVPASPEMADQLVVIRYRLCSIADELETQ